CMSVIAWINLGTSMNLMSSGRSIPTTLQILGFISLSIYLFFKPDILYGIPRTIYAKVGRVMPVDRYDLAEISTIAKGTEFEELIEEELQVDVNRTAPFNISLMEVYVDRLEAYLNEEESFKKQGININQLALELGMPGHHLSYVLNHHYQQRFTDFINTYRINYIKKRMESEKWRSFTLEGLAIEAGFSSRSTFFSAFKKTTGMNPSKYLELKGR
ncbi:MAG: AraC family transcriptional regulator, partial [Chryseobacterium sp.]